MILRQTLPVFLVAAFLAAGAAPRAAAGAVPVAPEIEVLQDFLGCDGPDQGAVAVSFHDAEVTIEYPRAAEFERSGRNFVRRDGQDGGIRFVAPDAPQKPEAERYPNPVTLNARIVLCVMATGIRVADAEWSMEGRKGKVTLRSKNRSGAGNVGIEVGEGAGQNSRGRFWITDKHATLWDGELEQRHDVEIRLAFEFSSGAGEATQ